MLKKSLIIVIFCLAFLLHYKESKAQADSSGLSINAPVEDQEAVDGDILCTYDGAIARCNQQYDPSIYGVISENAAAEFVDPDIENSKPVLTEGITDVRVSAENGSIQVGDFITTSTNPGIGVKADGNGYVVGVSLDDYNPTNPSDVTKIQILVTIHPVTGQAGQRGNLIQFIRKGIAVPIFEPLESLRYLLAVIIILISFTLGLVYFGKSSRSGIEAIGRNPLARRVIQLTVILNIGLTIVIVLVGLAIAYLILIL
jgi:F0F1-type ATP synthase membrane subunit c/vacuolar-type H+-ATPase subunit K